MLKMNEVYKNLRDAMIDRENEFEKGIRFIGLNGYDKFSNYAQVVVESKKILSSFNQNGVKKGDKVVIMVEKNQDFIPAFWACIYGGMVAVPLAAGDSSGNFEKLNRVIEELEKVFLLTEKENYIRYKDYIKQNKRQSAAPPESVIFTEEMRNVDKMSDGAEVDFDDLAIIQFSSGSTGTPKGVLITHKNIIEVITALTVGVSSLPEDICISWLPLTFDMGLIAFHILCFIFNEQQILMPTRDFLKSPEFWLDSIEKYKAEFLFCSNTALQMTRLRVKEIEGYNVDLSSVKVIFCGGEIISVSNCDEFYEDFKRFGIKENTILTVYGMAEATVGVAIPTRGEKYRAVKVDTRSFKIGSHLKYCEVFESHFVQELVDCGYPLDGIEVKIGDLRGNSLGKDTFGIIHIKGAYVTKGYLGAKNKEKFMEDGWFQTNDYGFFWGNRLVVTGRMDDAVIINGQNYYLSDFEKAMKQKNVLKNQQIIVCRIYENQDKIIAFYVMEEQKQEETSIDVASKIKEFFTEYALINVMYVLPITELPLNANGKVNRKELVEKYERGEFDDIIESINQKKQKNPDDGLQRENIQGEYSNILIEIWEELSGYRIDEKDNLLTYGIDSMAANTFVAKIQERLDIEVSITDLFYCKTIEEISQLITYKK